MPRNIVYVRPYRPSNSSLASIRINYSKLVAEAGPCGQWPRDLGPSANRDYNENNSY